MGIGTRRRIWAFLLAACCSARAQVDVSFMTFNLWHEGNSVTDGLAKIRDVIAAVDPDVIGFTETSDKRNSEIRAALAAIGKTYHRGYAGADVALLSKHPVVSSGMMQADVARFGIEVEGKAVTVLVAHLDYLWYACYLPRGYNGGNPDWNMIDDGAGRPKPITDVSRILAYNLNSGRDESVRTVLDSVRNRKEPVVLLGDFNEPSHRDWTARTKDLFDHHGAVVPWQTTTALEGGGFVDAFRQVYPDEVRNPGFTWPSFVDGKGPTTWTPKADDRDRIDFIFHRGAGVSARTAAIVGPKRTYALNAVTTANTADDRFLAENLPWPSDHKAFQATIRFPFTSTALSRVGGGGAAVAGGKSGRYAADGSRLPPDAPEAARGIRGYSAPTRGQSR